MKVTTDIIRCEFIGTEVKVAQSKNASCVGLCGKIIDETRNTFTLLHKNTRKIIVKETSVFHFRFSDGTVVEIDGKLLVGRAEDRLKKGIKRLW